MVLNIAVMKTQLRYLKKQNVKTSGSSPPAVFTMFPYLCWGKMV